jgi:hypothetical protein
MTHWRCQSPKVSLVGDAGLHNELSPNLSDWTRGARRRDYTTEASCKAPREVIMNVVHERCCGIDVHQATLAVCVSKKRVRVKRIS